MKALYFRCSLRERSLLLAFALLILLLWMAQLLGRGQRLWDEWRNVRAELAAQLVWRANAAGIAARATAAIRSLEPAKTLNATRLVGELTALAAKTGLTADISLQSTVRTDQFAFHTAQVNFRRAELAALLGFYQQLGQRSPYLGLDQFSLVVDRANPAQLNASFRVVAAELAH